MRGWAAALVAIAFLVPGCGARGPVPGSAPGLAFDARTREKCDVAEACSRLRVTQVGGFAGEAAMPPLIELDRDCLDEAGRRAMEDACRWLEQAAGGGTAPALGADLAGYRVEVTDAGGGTRSFELPGPGATGGLAATVDVPQLLAPLIHLSGPAR